MFFVAAAADAAVAFGVVVVVRSMLIVYSLFFAVFRAHVHFVCVSWFIMQ